VETKELEDRMHSFFLAETVKYLYLLYDEDNWLCKGNYLFNTEGHIFPVLPLTEEQENENVKFEDLGSCWRDQLEEEATCYFPDKNADHSCSGNTDCGISEVTCKWRKCSEHHFCFTPPL